MSKIRYFASSSAPFARRAVGAAILSIAAIARAQSLPQLPAPTPAVGGSAPAAAGTAPAARGVQMPATAGSAVVAPTADARSARLLGQLQHSARVPSQKHKPRKTTVKAKAGPNGTYTPKDAPNDTSLVSYDFDPDYTLVRDQLDDHFGVPIVETVDDVTVAARQALDAELPALLDPVFETMTRPPLETIRLAGPGTSTVGAFGPTVADVALAGMDAPVGPSSRRTRPIRH